MFFRFLQQCRYRESNNSTCIYQSDKISLSANYGSQHQHKSHLVEEAGVLPKRNVFKILEHLIHEVAHYL